MHIQSIHHVSLTVTDLERSRRFYRNILGLPEIERPPSIFRRRFQLGTLQQLTGLCTQSTFRTGRPETRDLHFAVRGGLPANCRSASRYREEGAEDEFQRMMHRMPPPGSHRFTFWLTATSSKSTPRNRGAP
jgi:catechol 2,3-dioxygenase-like lactoylglutathione lyase family enzyme